MIRFDKEHKGTVRIALNASFLQRLVGTGYYFFDDIGVPVAQISTATILSRDEENPLISASNITHQISDNDLRQLWISLCTRLAKNEQEYQHSNKNYLAIFLILWLVAMTLLIIVASDLSDLPVLVLLVPALMAVSTKWVFVLLPEKQGIYFTKSLMQFWNHQEADLEHDKYFEYIQAIVDDLAPSFAAVGYSLDYVENFRSNFPFLAYIRMTAPKDPESDQNDTDDSSSHSYEGTQDASVASIPSGTSSLREVSSSSLSEQLRRFQWDAWDEHSGQVADHIQQQNRLLSAEKAGPKLFGVQAHKVQSYRSVILYSSIPIGFFWLCLNSGFFSVW